MVEDLKTVYQFCDSLLGLQITDNGFTNFASSILRHLGSVLKPILKNIGFSSISNFQ